MSNETTATCCRPEQHLDSAVFFPFSMRPHVSINVPNIRRVLGFYMGLFGTKPCKIRDDYAKFELDDPPLNLTLNRQPPELASTETLAIEVTDAEAVAAYAERLDRIGAIRERGPDRLVVQDACGNTWEIRSLDLATTE